MTTCATQFESILAGSFNQFLEYKRALGCGFYVEESVLKLLDRYLVQQQIQSSEMITSELLDSFLGSRPRTRPRSYNHLLCTVRRLFDWLVQQGLWEQSPVKARSKKVTGQRKPFIFDRDNARILLAAAGNLKDDPRIPLRGNTYRTIFALLYGLGLRVGEACHLHVGDVDFQRRLLVIRQTKFYKSRLVPFGPRIENLLSEYFRLRSFSSKDQPLFASSDGRALYPERVSQAFHALVPKLQLAMPAGTSPPRLHDLRHSFAVGTLLRWYRTGADAQAGLLRLATFMGHVDPASTAVYLNITEAMLEEANRRFEFFAGEVIKEGETL